MEQKYICTNCNQEKEGDYYIRCQNRTCIKKCCHNCIKRLNCDCFDCEKCYDKMDRCSRCLIKVCDTCKLDLLVFKKRETKQCDACRVRGCDLCINIVCNDCNYDMCYNCTNNFYIECGCYGRCDTCDRRITRTNDGWPCNKCKKWLCEHCKYKFNCNCYEDEDN